MTIRPPSPAPSFKRLESMFNTFLPESSTIIPERLEVFPSHIPKAARLTAQSDLFSRSVNAAEAGTSTTTHSYVSYESQEVANQELDKIQQSASRLKKIRRFNNNRQLSMEGSLAPFARIKLTSHSTITPNPNDKQERVLITENKFEPLESTPSNKDKEGFLKKLFHKDGKKGESPFKG